MQQQRAKQTAPEKQSKLFPQGKASKLFIGINVSLTEEPYKHAGMSDEDRQMHAHMTFQWCGTEISDEQLAVIFPIWVDAIEALPREQRTVTSTSEYALFGKEHDVLVLKCKVSPELEDAVNAARAKTAAACPDVPPSDFDFSPHVTLGNGHTLPPPYTKHEDFGQFEFPQVMFWGDDYVLRGYHTLSDAPVAAVCEIALSPV